MPDSDIAILGAGCAGLSLAVQLREQGYRGSVQILDAKPEFTNDRTWCFFGLTRHPFRKVVSHRWQRWSVIGERDRADISSPSVAYEYLSGDAFYRESQRLIAGANNIDISLNCKVGDIRPCAQGLSLETSCGAVTAGSVFDSRPYMPQTQQEATPGAAREVDWLQHFAGWFIRTPKPTFDPSCARLMDFRVTPQPGAIHFMYLLPFSETEALVEDTYFSGALLDPQVYAAEIERYLEREGIADATVERKETGTIPMSTRTIPDPPHPNWFRIGVAAGMARPSTGYAFTNIQRHSQTLAAAVCTAHSHGAPILPPAVRRRRTAWLDRVFLSYLKRKPEDGPALFCQLFQNNPPERLARFLCEMSTPAEDAHVMQSLPGRKLVPEAMRTISSRLLDRLAPGQRRPHAST